MTEGLRYDDGREFEAFPYRPSGADGNVPNRTVPNRTVSQFRLLKARPWPLPESRP